MSMQNNHTEEHGVQKFWQRLEEHQVVSSEEAQRRVAVGNRNEILANRKIAAGLTFSIALCASVIWFHVGEPMRELRVLYTIFFGAMVGVMLFFVACLVCSALKIDLINMPGEIFLELDYTEISDAKRKEFAQRIAASANDSLKRLIANWLDQTEGTLRNRDVDLVETYLKAAEALSLKSESRSALDQALRGSTA